tara:strand:- start:604 stop:1098 length:495 start_codon:yes stop_codon:yes gene_type:complete
MSERKIFISKRCDHCIRLIVGLSKHDLLKYFDIINIDTINNIPPFVTSVPTLFHNGTIVSGQKLFDYMNDFAKKIMTVNEKKQENSGDDLEAWCPNGGCSIGFSEISENDDNFKENFHKDFGSSYETLSLDSQNPPSLNNENSNEDKRLDDFNKKYEDFVNSRK